MTGRGELTYRRGEPLGGRPVTAGPVTGVTSQVVRVFSDSACCTRMQQATLRLAN
ncbi:hypothetical protein [Streptomyces mirabilis]|uniref:hypothetical protein n=1 Tax=Streptomyces mirabilis TaxID=68239 RepID=UPI003686170D